jgi:hypothetical protein
MSNLNLILRGISGPYGDTNKGTVLTHSEMDNNFINLKGEQLKSGSTSGTFVTLTKFNGDVIAFDTQAAAINASLWLTGTGLNSIYVKDSGNSTGGQYALAEGRQTIANGNYSHSEGYLSFAGGEASHAEGSGKAHGNYSHAEGAETIAGGEASHASGQNSRASGATSFVHGNNSTAIGTNTVVLGANITGNTSDTTYVDNLNIKTLGGGLSVRNLGLDANGNVVPASGTFTGATFFSNGLSANTISATTYFNLPIKWYAEFSGAPTTSPIVYSARSIALGDGAEARSTNMFVYGINAGQNAITTINSIFMGGSAGKNADNSTSAIFMGVNTGNAAMSASSSIFIGESAGQGAIGSSVSNFIGLNAGITSLGSRSANFIGGSAGQTSSGCSESNFIGTQAGQSVTGATYSIFIGYHVGRTFTSNNVGSNNIIIGTNISLPHETSNSINIGGVLFGSNTYSGLSTNPSITAQTNGRIGINVINPTQALEVSGNTIVYGNVRANNLVLSAAPYVNDAAADADTALPSGGLYTITLSGRTVFRKP